MSQDIKSGQHLGAAGGLAKAFIRSKLTALIAIVVVAGLVTWYATTHST